MKTAYPPAAAALSAAAVFAAFALGGCQLGKRPDPTPPPAATEEPAAQQEDDLADAVEDVSGDWLVNSITADGVTLTSAQFPMLGAWTLELARDGDEWVEDEDMPEGSIYLDYDGTCEFEVDGESSWDCSWDGDGDGAVVEFEGTVYDTVIDEDGWLVLEDPEFESTLYYTADDPLGDMDLTLYDDGDFTFNLMGDTTEGEWEWDGEELTLSEDGDELVTGFLDEDGWLVLESGDGAMILLIPA